MSILDKPRPDTESFQAWANEHEPDDDMIHKPGYWSQIVFIRDRLFQYPFYKLAECAETLTLEVIGTHTSKSIKLPVAKITFQKRGCDAVRLELIVSYNYHMWSVTVRSSEPVSNIVKKLKLFDTSESCCYLYGFDSTDHLGCYDNNQREFSCTINDNYEMWAFMRTLMLPISEE
jgi:hypothetical protein